MILVCGEALIDLFVGAAEGTAMPARAVAGGSPFNVAIGLARLGVKAAFLASISRDRFGALLAGILVREGVDDRFLVRTDRLSTISMVATDDNGQPSYAFHGERGGSLVRAHQSAAELPPDVQALTFGSYTMAVEPVGSAFDALAERECGRRVTSVDPNLRRPWSATWSAGRRRPSASTGPRPSSRPATRMCAPPGAAACRSRKPPSIGSIAARAWWW